jgi:hypothetical protein
VLEDEFGIAGLMAVELKAWLACDQGLKKGFALDELQARNVLAIKVQEIEGVIDEPHAALAIGRNPDAFAGYTRRSKQRNRSALEFLRPIEVVGPQRHMRNAHQSIPFRFAKPVTVRALKTTALTSAANSQNATGSPADFATRPIAAGPTRTPA